MAIDLGTTNVALNKSDRTWRVEFFIDDSEQVQIRFHREEVYKINGAIQSRKNTGVTTRTLDQIGNKTYTVNATPAKGNLIVSFIDKMADVERQIDLDNPPATPGP